MSYKITTSIKFDKELKQLAKKYPSLKKEYAELLDELEINPLLGTALGKNCYKIRMAIASKGKGKSGGARIITYVQIINETVYLLSIYDKSEIENLSDAEILNLLKLIE
jgi:mRNA-degrading endonuclease RelE of RelBE toxin-antitoxin system